MRMFCCEALAVLIGAAQVSGASPAQLAAQTAALQRIESPRVIYDKLQRPRYILGRTRFSIRPDILHPDHAVKLDEIRKEILALFLGEGTETLEVTKLEVNVGRGPRLVFREAIAGIPVYGPGITLTTDSARRVVSIQGDFAADRGLPREAKISASRAAETALREFQNTNADATLGEPPALHYYVMPPRVEARPVRLVWVVRVNVKPGTPFVPVIIDAIEGTVVGAGELTSDLNLNARVRPRDLALAP
jgi:Zn-dependent metalloprotease